MKARPRRARALSLVLSTVLALGSGCQATGETANAYWDWGGRTFTTNPGSVVFYVIGFGVFFVGFLPLDLFSFVATEIGWSDGSGEDFQASALAPSMFMGTTGGVILGAPFFPFGLPWWNPDEEAPKAKPEEPTPVEPPPDGTPRASAPRAPERDDSPSAGAPH